MYSESVLIASVSLPVHYYDLISSAFGITLIALSIPIEAYGKSGLQPQQNLMSTLNMSFSVATTILSTLLITIRILISSNFVNATNRNRYSKTIEILIESSALYSIAFLIEIPFYIMGSTTVNRVGMAEPCIDGIAQSMTVRCPLATLNVQHR